MHQAAFPERFIFIAPPVLGYGVLHVLVGEMIFKLHRHNRQAIEQNDDIRRLIRRSGRKMHLPHRGKAISLILRFMLAIAISRGFEVRQLQVNAAERHAIP